MNFGRLFIMKKSVWILMLLLLSSVESVFPQEQSKVTEIVPLEYITPAELIAALQLDQSTSAGYQLLVNESVVSLRLNPSNNELLIFGDPNDIIEAKKVIGFLDVPPRQIVIEVKIVEVESQKMDQIGIDWQLFLDRSRFNLNISHDSRTEDQEVDNSRTTNEYQNVTRTSSDKTIQVQSGNLAIGDFIKLVQDSEAGKVINVPKIVTTNNKTGKILDGAKITYVSRYSSYSNIYETREITTGLSLAVTPSLGESGFLKLDVNAKMTTLGAIIADSPSETGQILENTVIVKNNEPFLLGGFKKTETIKMKRKVPLLGAILPYLFSKTENVEVTKDVLIILTPEVIDLNGATIPQYE